MKKKFLVDIDDTIGNLWKSWIKGIKDTFGEELYANSLEDIPYWDYYMDSTKAGMRVFDVIMQKGFYASVEPMEGASDILSRLHVNGYEIKLVTSTPYEAMKEKVEWVGRHFPFIKYTDIILAHEKHHISGDFLIDDNAHKNLLNWCTANPNGVGIAFSAGYNKGWNPRISSWYELPELLKNYGIHI